LNRQQENKRVLKEGQEREERTRELLEKMDRIEKGELDYQEVLLE